MEQRCSKHFFKSDPGFEVQSGVEKTSRCFLTQSFRFWQAKNNNRFAKKIIMTVKAGGADPESNRALAVVLAQAKANDVPNDVIKRNIEKAASATTADFKESLFEFIGPGNGNINRIKMNLNSS